MTNNEVLTKIKSDFINLQTVFVALGDEARQNILLILIESNCKGGLRVGEITEKVHLSRPAVSHHLKLLREAGLVSIRKEGTKNYYFIHLPSKFKDMQALVDNIERFMEEHYEN